MEGYQHLAIVCVPECVCIFEFVCESVCVCIRDSKSITKAEKERERYVQRCRVFWRVCVCVSPQCVWVSAQVTGGAETAETQRGH